MKPIAVVGTLVCLLSAISVVLLVDRSRPEDRDHARGVKVARNSSVAGSQPGLRPGELPSNSGQLALDINRAQQIIDDPTRTSRDLASAGLFEQLATGTLAREPPSVRRMMLAMLEGQAAATMRTNLEAAAALSRLTVPRKRLPPWRIAQPPAPNTLLGYFRDAQSRSRIGWQYLAAIEFIETRFGRIHGPSSAGAQGPMQFLPSTWARYGSGNINSQRDAILGAARYLVANGAPDNIQTALFRYNNSPDYVTAVQDYANRMRADPRAYDGYYNWQVIYERVGGTFILPVGYPTVRPEPVR